MERPSSRFTRAVGFANLLNLVLFQVLFLIAAMLRPRYSPVSQSAGQRSGYRTVRGVG
jgi:hypothetical protein